MTTTKNDERIAILLKSLGSNVAQAVLQYLPTDRTVSMQAALDELEASPPEADEIDEVLDEFNRFMTFALRNSGGVSEEESSQKTASKMDLPEFVSSGDPFEDLQNLHDFQIAGALREESAPTIAVVLGCLSTQRAAEVIQQLPDTVRKDVFLKLNTTTKPPQPLLIKILESTVAKASQLDIDAASDPDHVADEKTAQLLRSMDRATRKELLLALEEKDEEMAARIKELLFVFDDIMRISNRSAQKLLAEVDSSTLATALKNASPDLVERLLSNLSKRAKATLMEEIEFMGPVNEEQDTAARKQICDVLGKLDQAGDLELVD